ncbi:POM152 [Candida pseudojiufengensis]|uniref:POM152 n=1 Tax=Candida pseudojiufengensis TaxID=497109 RepID=UPI0022254241|nr:POM152 [Candida pseudojiufengensis]KAI5964721.1 POM152 [Candida pseudojiufengensis]
MEQQNGRNWENRTRKRGKTAPLIPSSILDQASQRIFIVSLFILIQTFKLYDLILLKTELPLSNESSTNLTSFSFVLKYTLIDGLFLWILPILNIQYLTFSPSKTLLFTLLLNLISIFLVSSYALPLLTNFLLPIWKFISQKKELNIIGESISKSKVIDIDSHFKGKLTIHYLPDSSAKMNPFNFDHDCLGSANNFDFGMPIEFNTSAGIGFLQVQQTTPQNDILLHNYTGHTLNKLFKKDYTKFNKLKNAKKDYGNVFYLEFPIKEPGMYKLKSVLDRKGNSIRLYKSEFEISNCPSAKFFYPPHFEFDANYKCLSTFEQKSFPVPWLEVYGPTPSFVNIDVKLDGRKFKSFNVTIKQDVDNRSKSRTTDYNYLTPVKLLRNSLEQSIVENINDSEIKSNSILEFQLLSIRDSFGNVHRYQPLSKDKDVWFKLNLKSSPTISLIDYSKEKKLLVNGTKTLQITRSDEFTDEDFPVKVILSHNGKNSTKIFESKKQLKEGIQVNEPGSYQIITADTKFCPCKIAETEPITIVQAEIPQLKIVAEQESDRCLGVVGYNFDFNFTGEAPFKVQYQIYSNKSGVLKPVATDTGKINRDLISQDHSHSFKFKPPSEGSFTIVFNNLKDVNYYEKGFPLSERYQTYFRQASEISLQSKSPTIYTCYGDTAKISMKFKGNGPFSFDYEYVDPQNRKRFGSVIKVKNVTSYLVETPKSLIGKNYEIELSNAKDILGCDAKIVNQDRAVRVVSRPDIPELELPKDKKQIVDGAFVVIPLKYKSSIGLSGNDIIYLKHWNLNGEDMKIQKADLRGSSLKLSNEGIYALESFENFGCKGKVIHAEHKVIITYYEKPSLTISSTAIQHRDESTIQLKPVCNGKVAELDLTLKGTAPFLVDYEIKLPNGRIEAHTMTVENHDIKIKLPTRENGQYEHKFKRIYDAKYTKHSGTQVNLYSPTVIYKVNQLPSAQFISGKHFSQICENKLNDDDLIIKLPIKLIGSYPFDVDVTIKNEETGKSYSLTFNKIYEPFLPLSNIKFFTLGDYSITIDKISDHNGCTNYLKLDSIKYILSITEPPNIFKTLPQEKHYCVGDHVSYTLTGVPPITIYYEYNNINRKAESYNIFKRLASKPGILNIKALKDSGGNQCLVNFTKNIEKSNSLQLQVHDLPSVEVNKGDYIVEDIHQGDQTELVFTFIGEPPFKLTYVRTIDVKEGHKKVRRVVEKETIKDIWDYQYIVLASLEGTYEAIEVEDKFCRAIKTI